MNIYYMPKPRYKKDYKRIDKLEQKFARIIKTISFIILSIIGLILCCNSISIRDIDYMRFEIFCYNLL